MTLKIHNKNHKWSFPLKSVWRNFPSREKTEKKNTHTKPFDNMSLDFLAIYSKEQYNNINIKLQWNFSFTINFELGNFHIFRGEGGGDFCAAEQQ